MPALAHPAGLLAVLAAVAGCTSAPAPGPVEDSARALAARPSAVPSLTARDLAGLPVSRRPFCAAIPEEAASSALAGPVAQTRHYRTGDEVELTPGYRDIVHENGCVFVAPDGTVARAWVLGRAVDGWEAGAWVRRARRGRGCSTLETIDFGTPGIATICDVPSGALGERDGVDAEAARRVRLAGLFGTSWLSCEVTAPGAGTRPEDLLRRTEEWCTAVATAAHRGVSRPDELGGQPE